MRVDLQKLPDRVLDDIRQQIKATIAATKEMDSQCRAWEVVDRIVASHHELTGLCPGSEMDYPGLAGTDWETYFTIVFYDITTNESTDCLRVEF